MARTKTFDIIDFAGGMNNYGDARDIENNEFETLLNVIPLKKGEIICGYNTSSLDTSSYPTISSNITVPKILSKSLLSYKSDYNSELEEVNTEHLLYSDGNKLYRLEYNGSAWSWAEITNLNSTGILYPSIGLFDGIVRYSDGSFSLNSSSPYLPSNSTKFFGAVSRKYFNATTNSISEITQDSSILKPTDGKIVFNNNIETASNNPTRGFLGLEIDAIENDSLETLTFGDSNPITFTDEPSGYVASKVSVQTNFTQIGSIVADVSNEVMNDIYGTTYDEVAIAGSDGFQQFITSSVVSAVGNINAYQIGTAQGATGYNYFFISVNPDNYDSEWGKDSEFSSTVANKSIKIKGVFAQNNSGWSRVNWQYTDFSPIIHKVNADGTIGDQITPISTDNNQQGFLQHDFYDDDSTTMYRVGVKTAQNEIAEIEEIELYHHLATDSNDATDLKHLRSYVSGASEYRLEMNDLFNTDFQTSDNLINVKIAVPDISLLTSIEFIITDDHTYSSSSNNLIYVLGQEWLNENKGMGWKDVVIDLTKISNIENTPVIGALPDFIMRLNYSNATTEISVAVDSISQVVDKRGTWNGNYKFYYSWVYDRVQETGYYEFENQLNGIYLQNERLSLKTIIRELSTGGFGSRGKRITGANIYYKEWDKDRQEEVIDDPFLLAKCDFEKGVIKSQGTSINAWSLGDTATDHYTHTALQFIDPSLSNTFSINAGYDYDPLNTIEEIRFRSAISLNRRMYYGNVDVLWEKFEGETNYRRNLYGDRIYKSLPNKPDVIPAENFLDVDINDGDEVTALASYADRLLVYKHNTMYLVNATKTLEYLEDTYKYMGVMGSKSICYTNNGVAWVNLDGAYFYNGETVINLIDKKLSRDLFASHLTVGTDKKAFTIAYEPKEKHLVIYADNGNGWIYNFISQSWSKSNTGLDDSANKRSNLELHNNTITQASINSSDNVTFHSHAIDTTASNSVVFDIRTKDYSITDIGQRKDIKAIYLTYKGTMSGARKVSVEYFADKQSNAIAVNPSDLTTSPSGFTTIKVVPTPKSSGRKVHTIQVRIKSSGDDGLALRNFELHDVSIIYREKSIK